MGSFLIPGIGEQMLTEDDVRHVATLARLGLSEEEVETFRVQLLELLQYIAKLQEVDTSAIPPTAQILSHLSIARPDEPRPSWPPEAILSNAPDSEESFVRVPAVLEEERGATESAAVEG
jgi:aspartyl-tRNA(Asn)/glutamyl-tRNA(Gln) amidotransferase subunit C